MAWGGEPSFPTDEPSIEDHSLLQRSRTFWAIKRTFTPIDVVPFISEDVIQLFDRLCSRGPLSALDTAISVGQSAWRVANEKRDLSNRERTGHTTDQPLTHQHWFTSEIETS